MEKKEQKKRKHFSFLHHVSFFYELDPNLTYVVDGSLRREMELTECFHAANYGFCSWPNDIQAVGRFLFRGMRDTTMTREVVLLPDVLVSRPSGNQSDFI